MPRSNREPKSVKVTTWTYRRNMQVIVVPVRMVTNTYGTHFEVKLDEYRIHEKDENIDKLQDKVYLLLDEHTSVEWKPYLLLTVAGGIEKSFEQRRGSHGAEFAVHVDIGLELHERAVRKDGKEVWRNGGRMSEEPPSTGVDVRGMSFNNLEYDTVTSLVEDNPANRAALTLLAEQFEALVARMTMMFAPENAQKTLAAAVGGLLLAPAPPQTTDPEVDHARTRIPRARKARGKRT